MVRSSLSVGSDAAVEYYRTMDLLPRLRSPSVASLVLLALSAAFASAVSAQDQEPAATADDVVPRPRLVTAATKADEARLADLQRPGRILFRDDFESDDSLRQWFEIRGRDDGRAVRVDDADLAHRGRGCMRFTVPARDGAESGAGASAWLGAEGHERLYFRRWIRFAADYDQGPLNHTGGGVAAVAGGGKWDGMGKAGVRPDGTDRFTVGFEPWRDWGRQPSPGYMFCYVYWMDMQRDRDGNFWGNMLQPVPADRIVPPRGEWVCLEQMVQVNTVTDEGPQPDGELAAWIDGELYLHFDGIRWRSDARVLPKRVSIGIYIHHAEQDNVVCYDDVVVSTGYVGPAPPRRSRKD